MNINDEIVLPCGSELSVKSIRNYSDTVKDNKPEYRPFVELCIKTEMDLLDEYPNEEDDYTKKVSIPIQLRSIDPLITFLIKLKEELQK